MASYRGHLATSTALGGAYAGAAMLYFDADWGTATLAGGLCAVGGLLPDLDSQSGVPVRELFGLSAVLVPLMMLRMLIHEGLTAEQIFVILAGVYLLIRFGVRAVFKRLTVHRGMFHSLPAMVITGEIIFLGYHHPALSVRLFLAVGVMIGFLSHLVLDELCSVDLNGGVPRLNQFAGSAVKLMSKSTLANMTCFSLLAVLSYFTLNTAEQLPAHLEPRSLLEYLREGRSRLRQSAPAAPASPTTQAPEPAETVPTAAPAPPVVSVPAPGPMWRPAPPLRDEMLPGSR